MVRLGHLVDIVSRVFESLDLNPLLISAVNNVTSLLDDVVGEVDSLLGSITQGGTTLSFVVGKQSWLNMPLPLVIADRHR